MNNDLISREALLKQLEKCRFDGNALLDLGQLKRDIRIVKEAPTIEERPKGG